FLLVGQQPRPQNTHGGFTVLDQGFFVLHSSHNAGWQVRDTDRGVGGVNVLTTRTRCPVYINFQVGLVDLDLFWLINFGENQHACRRGMDTTLGFGNGYTLYTVDATVILQVGEDTFGRIIAIAGETDVDVFMTD